MTPIEAQKMKDAFVSKAEWDKTIHRARYDVMDVIIRNVTSSEIAEAGEMVLGKRWTDPGWNYSYEEMIAVFNTMIRLTKLKAFQ